MRVKQVRRNSKGQPLPRRSSLVERKEAEVAISDLQSKMPRKVRKDPANALSHVGDWVAQATGNTTTSTPSRKRKKASSKSVTSRYANT